MSRNRKSGKWLLASMLAALVGVISLAGVPRHARAAASRPAAITAPSGAEMPPVYARAETDTLDLQLD